MPLSRPGFGGRRLRTWPGPTGGEVERDISSPPVTRIPSMTGPLSLGDTLVTRVGLGTNRLTNTPANQAFLREALGAGVDFIDTAHLYTGGDSELTIGAALAPFPEGCLVATKGGYRPGEGRPETLSAQIEQSLRSLRVDRIELYYLHRVDPETPLETSLAVIREYRRIKPNPARGHLRGWHRRDRASASRSYPSRPYRTTTTCPSAGTTM